MSGAGGHYTSRAASEADPAAISSHMQDLSINAGETECATGAPPKSKSPRPRPDLPADKPAESVVAIVPGQDLDITAQERREFRTDTISYDAQGMIGHGSFGAVFQARVVETNEIVAIKKVLQDKRFKNRELQIMRQLTQQQHPFIVALKHYFVSKGSRNGDVYLNLVLEFVPETLYSVGKRYHRLKQNVPISTVRLYMYQLSRALAHIHSMGICHRDIKPQNLLVDPARHTLKLCDFGSAKVLVKGDPNVAYICSRYYRAPELIFGAMDYNVMIDVWSHGCVFAELLIGSPLFPGSSGIDQLVEIIKVLGTPSKEELNAMNPSYKEFKFPQIPANPWGSVFKAGTPPEAIDLIGKMLSYIPSRRTKAIEACVHPFFDELRAPSATTHDGTLIHISNFQFTPEELTGVNETLLSQLCPSHLPRATAPSDGGMPSIPEDGELINQNDLNFIEKIEEVPRLGEDVLTPKSTPFSSLNHANGSSSSIHRNTVVAQSGETLLK